MKNSHELYNSGGFRILEILDEIYEMENLKGDCFDPRHNPEIDAVELAAQEFNFEQKVFSEGVYGYVLEQWFPDVGRGWETVDSCWGFVGRHADENHYIVQELIDTAIRGDK